MIRFDRSHLMRAGSTLFIAIACGACGDPVLPPAAPPPPTSEPEAPATSPRTTTPSEPDAAPEIIVGREWTDVTANLTGMESWCGNLAFVSARPDTDQVLASVAGQGLFANEPGSDDWLPHGRGPESAPIDHRTSGFVYDPENPDVYWESGYFGLGPPPTTLASSVNLTIDGGTNFVPVGNDQAADLVSVDLTDPERRTLLIGLRGEVGAYASFDGGVTWSDVTADLPTDLGRASFPHVVDASTFLLGTHQGDRGEAAVPGVFRTVDAGASWDKVYDEAVSGPPLASAGGGLFWVLDGGGVIGSDDDGATWNVVSDSGPGGDRFLDARRNRIVETSEGTWLSMSASALVWSDDRGDTWQRIIPGLPFDPAGFTYSESRDEVFVWQNECDFEAGVNPVAEESIVRLELDLDPDIDPAS